LNVRKNFLTSLEFVENLENLEKLELDDNAGLDNNLVETLKDCQGN
jgi:hypothetical protein